MTKYSVDWTDAHYPEILRDPDGEMTLAEAKQEVVVDHFGKVRDHARVIVARTRMLKAEDILDR